MSYNIEVSKLNEPRTMIRNLIGNIVHNIAITVMSLIVDLKLCQTLYIIAGSIPP